MAGLDASGLTIKKIEDVQDDMNVELRATFGPQVNLTAPSIISQVRDIVAERANELWQLAQSIYSSQYPDTAEGVPLDNVAAITGISRLKANKTLVPNVYLFGTVGQVIPAGSQLSVGGSPTSVFETKTAVTLAAGTNAVQKVTFSGTPASGTWKLQYYNQVTASLAFNASATAVQTALRALSYLGSTLTVTGNYSLGFTITFLGTSGLQPQPLLVVNTNTLVTSAPAAVALAVVELTAGVAQGTVNASALSTGVIAAPAFSLNTIDTPITGLSAVINQLDGTVGRDLETNAALRLRRNASLALGGSATVEAIRSTVLNIEGVTSCLVFENDSYITDSAGRPKKSFEVVVAGTASVDSIVQAIWLNKPAGIATYGNASQTVTDSMGFTRLIYYSEPYVVPIYAIVNVTRDVSGDGDPFPSNGAVLIQTALSAYVAASGIGKDVIPNPGLQSAIEPIPGIYNVEILVGIAPVPSTSLPVAIAAQEVAELQTANITVNVT